MMEGAWARVLISCGGICLGLQAGAVCEFKIQQAKSGLQAYEQKPSPESSKLQAAREELERLQTQCNDEQILQELRAYIASLKDRLTQANATLAKARESRDKSAIQQATLAQKLAQIEYIAARQEELRLQDLLK